MKMKNFNSKAFFLISLILLLSGCSRLFHFHQETPFSNSKEPFFESTTKDNKNPTNNAEKVSTHFSENSLENQEYLLPEANDISYNNIKQPSKQDSLLLIDPNTIIEVQNDSPLESDIYSSTIPREDKEKGPETNSLFQENKFQPDQRQENLDAALQLCQEAQKEWEEGRPDAAIEYLDRAYEFLVVVNPDDVVDLLQQKDDLRFLVSKRIVEIYASRQNIINGNHNEIPMVLNEHVKTEINYFLQGEQKYFLQALKRAGLYRPMILKKLQEAGLPDKLSWLPLVESRFKVKALSRARALGLWQFIPSTGYKFGLKRDKWIDERMDPEKATKAAIEYLTQLHKIFGDWTTALAAYNCGEGKVLRVIRKQHLNYLDNFWDLYERLPTETARYVPRFLAAIHITENPDKYNIALDDVSPPLQYEEISVTKQIQLKTLAEKLGIKEKELTGLNPELRYQITPNYEYSLKIPLSMGTKALNCIASIPEWSPPKSDYVTVRIKKGETLSHLAAKYKTSVASIMRANNITRANRIRAGKKIRIPLKQSQTNLSTASPSVRFKIYNVIKGDCPFAIAKNYNMRLTEFLSLNGLNKESLLYPGQRVLVKRQ